MTADTTQQDALTLWQERLAFYEAEQAKAADPAQRFQLHKAIENANAEIARLTTEAATSPLAPTLQRRSVGQTLRVDLARLPAGAAHFLGRGPS
jgi:hypothetical protein